MTDLSFKLNDADHTRSNITRAMRIFAASGLEHEAGFIEALYRAASITRQQSTISKRATPGNGPGILNRAPYFFRVLEDLLGLKDDPHQHGAGPEGGAAP